MKIFLSWSGETSKAVAEALRDWVPNVIQDAEPWVSTADIGAGAHWAIEIGQQLESASMGVICLTPSSLQAPWLLFEAGALSKSMTNSRVIPFLFDVQPEDLKGPLAQFQAVKADKDGTKRLLYTINQTRTEKDKALSSSQLDKNFEKWWGDLEMVLTNVPRDLHYLSKEFVYPIDPLNLLPGEVLPTTTLVSIPHIKPLPANSLGMNIKIGGIFRGEKLKVVSSNWAQFAQGYVKSGWLYSPRYQGFLSHAVAFFKVHCSLDGTGYAHLLDTANPVHTIWLETGTGFKRQEDFCWDENPNVQRSALWHFTHR